VKALGATPQNDNLFSFKRFDAVKLRCVHESALAQLFKLASEWQAAEIVTAHSFSLDEMGFSAFSPGMRQRQTVKYSCLS
jgi:hypothetical protein